MSGRLLTTAVGIVLAAGWAWAGEPAAAPPAPTSDAQFFGELAFRDVATAADTARALVILVSEGKELGGDFEACKTFLAGKGVLPDGWLSKVEAAAPTDKGHLASLICRALGLKGGLWMRILGPLPRLAINECAYLELMVPGCEYSHVSGGELAGVIDRADRFRAKGTDKEVPELKGEPSGAAEEKP